MTSTVTSTVTSALIIAVMFAVAGLVSAGWGVRAISHGSRPLDLVGAMAAAGGVFVAALGGVMLVVPGFLWGR